MHKQQPIQLTNQAQLNKLYSELQKKCQQLQDFEDPGSTLQSMIQQFGIVQQYITNNQMFSENQKVKDIHTQYLKYLALPYYVGFLYGRLGNPRKQAIQQGKNYLEAFVGLVELFNCQDQVIFPNNIYKTWVGIKQRKDFNYPRDQVIANHKQKKLIEQRYKNNKKIQDEGDQRQSIKDFITMKIYESITQLKSINEEFQMLQYKATLQKDPEAKKKHEQQQQKPIPKMKVWQVKKKQQIHQCMCPPHSLGQHKKQLVAQVWQQNANKPTMTLEEVAQLQIDNMHERTEREKKQQEANKKDSDSDKQEVDDRKKKEARGWDNWKDDHEKGAGNRGAR